MVVSKVKAFYATPVSISKLSFWLFSSFTSWSCICWPCSMTVKFVLPSPFSSEIHKYPCSQLSMIYSFFFFLLSCSLSCSPPVSSLFSPAQARTHWLWCLWKPRKELMLWKTFFTTRVTPAPASMEIDPRETEKKLCISSALGAPPSWWLQL